MRLYRSILKLRDPFLRSLNTRALPLLSDPLNLSTTKKIRDTHSKFEKPEILSFDVFGTLYSPKRSVAHLYHEIASQEFGISKSLDSIEQDFPTVFNELQNRYPNYGKYDENINSCDEWWLEVIVKLFEIPHYLKDKKSADFCQRVLDHFAEGDAYALYDDVIPVLTELTRNGIKLIISSNSDLRMRKVVKSLGLSEFFLPDDIYLSYELGVSKPDKTFFDTVIDHCALSGSIRNVSLKPDLLEKCWHIGDSYSKDFLGAIKAGWNGVYLDRERESALLSPNSQKAGQNHNYSGHMSQNSTKDIQLDDLVLLSNNRAVAVDLFQLLTMFDFDPSQPSKPGNYNDI
ncbi:uncharacterized protein PRCAT00000992001 [Priceomyces carsonii]|uniref:uncharacterized protein n=1 Tax=Priceomyces carsonii TaxID=28549 RepID=UPI002ED828B7|nr:unnamed protein product [Priceomyces carsonii]